jgi:hypothetical protein
MEWRRRAHRKEAEKRGDSQPDILSAPNSPEGSWLNAA